MLVLTLYMEMFLLDFNIKKTIIMLHDQTTPTETKPTEEAVNNALFKSNGKPEDAAMLLGCSQEELRRLIPEYGIVLGNTCDMMDDFLDFGFGDQSLGDY